MCWGTGPSIPSHPRWDKIEGGVYLEHINKLTSGCRPLVGEYKGATAGCRQLRAKMAKIIIFRGFFRRCFRTPRCIPMKFESSIVMYSPIHLPKYQPNRPTGGRAIGRGVWQSKAKNGENCHFSSVFPPPLSHTSSHPNEI